MHVDVISLFLTCMGMTSGVNLLLSLLWCPCPCPSWVGRLGRSFAMQTPSFWYILTNSSISSALAFALSRCDLVLSSSVLAFLAASLNSAHAPSNFSILVLSFIAGW